MATVEEKLAKSLTAQTIELLPYLDYLLQDLWELGSSPKDMMYLITKHFYISKQTKVLDLACGKGAVSIAFAKEFGCQVKGIDIMTPFIDFAREKAKEQGVEKWCTFEIGDINQAVLDEKDHDIVILGAVGDVLGNEKETLLCLKNTIKKSGHILIDDEYGTDEAQGDFLTKKQWMDLFLRMGLELVDDKVIQNEELIKINDEQQTMIIKRANELKEKHPDKAFLFDDYIKSQQAECFELENEILGVTMLLKLIEDNGDNDG